MFDKIKALILAKQIRHKSYPYSVFKSKLMRALELWPMSYFELEIIIEHIKTMHWQDEYKSDLIVELRKCQKLTPAGIVMQVDEFTRNSINASARRYLEKNFN
jgi:hypothetical protein